MKEAPRPVTFLVVWLGQLISTFGTQLTGFALGVWIYQQTGSATRFALVGFVTILPGILLSPLAGALADRWDRRWAMLLGDLTAGCGSLVLAGLSWADRLELWHIYILLSVSSAAAALQWPAFSAATTLLVPRQHLARAAGLTQSGNAVAEISAPLVAGALMVSLGLKGILLIDLLTFAFAVLTLLVVRFPRPEVTAEGAASRGSLVREAWAGWLYIRHRPGLTALLALMAAANFSMGMMQVLVTPLVMSFASVDILGRVLSGAAIGMLTGSVVLSVWGGPRRRVLGILGFMAIQGGALMAGGLRPNALLIATAGFVLLFCMAIAGGCSQALWQSTVAPDLQSRVFAVRRMVAWSTLPLAYLVAGPLADRVFEPLLAPGGFFADSLGRWIGVGEGRGIAFLFLLLGLLLLLTVMAFLPFAPLRRLDSADVGFNAPESPTAPARGPAPRLP